MLERRVIAIQGVVQGVGFRPFVHRLASALDLRGLVRNESGGVVVDVEGESQAIEALLSQLSAGPPLATIDSISARSATPLCYHDFQIASSGRTAEWQVLVSPDLATCDTCLAELFDPANRRYRHPFISCTNCGPRFTIVRELPYDRPGTSMASFTMCEACRREYENPSDRRFHAQPIACWDCGPTLRFDGGGGGASRVSRDALQSVGNSLARGEIVAIKGLGGFHLACSAIDSAAVRRLRARKHREAKPLAVMVAGLDRARELCELSDLEAELLCAPSHPIVLLERRPGAAVAPEVAPGARRLGVMLPYTPVHHILLADDAGPLVMTSGNRSDEPIAYDDRDAATRLVGIADRFLFHDRPIVVRSDDSVVRAIHGGTSWVRRSRGVAPRSIRLTIPFPVPVLGTGAHLKNTFCLGKGHHAFLSHHVGDLENLEAYRALEHGIAHFGRLFDIQPEIVAHDLHPDYLSTKLADTMERVELVPVQHHHAHVAACVSEHGVTEPVLGVAFDGAGLGSDGAVWGGEFIWVEGASFRRLAHLGYVGLPGGDAAARQPWRVAAAHLWSTYGDDLERLPIRLDFLDQERWPVVRQMLSRGVNCPATSSVGRLFDAVAALVGLRGVAQFEGQAAMELENVADPDAAGSYPVELRESGEGWMVDPGPLIRGVVEDLAAGRSVAHIAGAFHNSVSEIIVAVTEMVRQHTGLSRVALTGGVFQNALITERSTERLERRGFEVLLHRRVPCNDGGLSLGQAYVAGRIAAGSHPCA